LSEGVTKFKVQLVEARSSCEFPPKIFGFLFVCNKAP